jgi:tetratricopeptide (TPR) repeat protein
MGIDRSGRRFQLGEWRLRLLQSGRYQVPSWQMPGAIGDSDQALQLQPDNADTYARRGNSKCELGQFQEDFADLKSALELAQEAGDSALAAGLEQLIQRLEQE